MSKFKVQFQRGTSLQQFLHGFGSEEQCRKAVYRMRWPNGFCCPACGHDSHCQPHTRALSECHRCQHQTSLTAGTVMAPTHLPLTQWFLAMYLLSQSKNGTRSTICAIQEATPSQPCSDFMSFPRANYPPSC